MLLSQYRPRPKLVTPQHMVETPRFPVIRVRNRCFSGASRSVFCARISSERSSESQMDLSKAHAIPV